MDSTYNPPLSLTIIGTIFIGLATLVAAWITYDIIVRRGWETMMAIMIPVYILNALYLAPLTIWTYLKYGRPVKPVEKAKEEANGGTDSGMDVEGAGKHEHHGMGGHEDMQMHGENHDVSGESHMDHDMAGHGHVPKNEENHGMGAEGQMGTHAGHDMSGMDQMNHDEKGHDMAGHDNIQNHGGHDMSGMNHGAMHNMHMPSPDQPMFPTVTIAVCHCGAGCLLGDIVGEWLVYGANTMINGRSIWPEFLIDYAFALLFGIFFQYFAIAPMTGDYGPKTLWRATKADFLSLTFFEIGLFGWMAIFQLAIFDSRLGVNNVVYWWMMQIGMFFGHWTAFPINWWLITSGVKERTS